MPRAFVLLIAFGAFVVLAPIWAVLLRYFVIEAFRVPAGSMLPTIAIGDHLFVDKTLRGKAPKRGDVIVFAFPEHPEQDFVKRAIASGGDVLEMRAGHPVINGWPVPFCRLGPYRYAGDSGAHEGESFVEFLDDNAYVVFLDSSSPADDHEGPFKAAPGETWVLGDNRNNSHDSRRWFEGKGGGVPAALVRGRARWIWQTAEPSHQFADLAGDPVAPSRELAPALARCLAARPAREKTSPPAAR